MGPLRLLDEVGWDIAASVCRVMGDAFPDRLRASDLFAAMKEAELFGRKNGEGIYRYGGKGEPRLSRRAMRLVKSRGRSAAPPPKDGDLLDRLLLPLVSEAFLCRQEGLVADDGDLDLAMIMGIGWPPHTGGPLRWAHSRGLERLVERMDELAARYGPSLAPSPPLRAAALAGAAGRAPAAGVEASWIGG
jgi:3-hydroxyacyl-CoA dehydrogenase